MGNRTLESAQAELVRLERMVIAQRQLVARLTPNQPSPTYLRPRSQDRTLAPRRSQRVLVVDSPVHLPVTYWHEFGR